MGGLLSGLLQEWCYEGEDVFCHDLVACGGGVGFVGLHHAGYAEDSLQQEGQHGDTVLAGE